MKQTDPKLQTLIHTHGFSAAYAFPPTPLGAYWESLYQQRPPHTGGLCLDPKSTYPFASTVLLLVKAYTPYPIKTHIPAYYLASNAGYHATNALTRALIQAGVRAEHIEVPLAALVTKHEIGTLTRSGLLDIPPFGTRTALFTIVTDAIAPDSAAPDPAAPDFPAPSSIFSVFPTPPPPALQATCTGCTRCADACPAGAIHPKTGLHASACLRTYMETAPMPQAVMRKLPGLLGCEICQSVCPRNAAMGVEAPTPEIMDALSLPRLLRGDIAHARTLLGKNMCTQARLQAQAAILYSNDGGQLTAEDIAYLRALPGELAQSAAAYVTAQQAIASPPL